MRRTPTSRLAGCWPQDSQSWGHVLTPLDMRLPGAVRIWCEAVTSHRSGIRRLDGWWRPRSEPRVFKRKAALAQARRPCESSASAEERLQKSVLTEARELIHGVLACINGIKSNPEVAKMLRKTVAAASFSASNRRRRVVTGLAIFAAVLAAVMSGSPRAGAVLPPPDG